MLKAMNAAIVSNVSFFILSPDEDAIPSLILLEERKLPEPTMNTLKALCGWQARLCSGLAAQVQVKLLNLRLYLNVGGANLTIGSGARVPILKCQIQKAPL